MVGSQQPRIESEIRTADENPDCSLLAQSDPKSRRIYDFVKRLMDLLFSMTALVVCAPAFLIIAALVRLGSPGPIFFRQRRVGQFGKEFNFIKFRTMHVSVDSAIHKEYVTRLTEGSEKSTAVYKIRMDPRVTPIGRFLRKTSLDELPQFFNVLRGEMSLVGPRPPIPYEVQVYQPWHMRRLIAKPGITGLWQVEGRSRITFDEMVKMDIWYCENRSFWLDLRILLKTPLAIFSVSGAY
jgi:exopolysaccharide biosynthesis polyprenyl glycosylphosphotransferase